MEEGICTSAWIRSILKELRKRSVRQHMYYDLIKEHLYGTTLDNSELAFTRNQLAAFVPFPGSASVAAQKNFAHIVVYRPSLRRFVTLSYTEKYPW